jgi:hypothetical protein
MSAYIVQVWNSIHSYAEGLNCDRVVKCSRAPSALIAGQRALLMRKESVNGVADVYQSTKRLCLHGTCRQLHGVPH